MGAVSHYESLQERLDHSIEFLEHKAANSDLSGPDWMSVRASLGEAKRVAHTLVHERRAIEQLLGYDTDDLVGIIMQLQNSREDLTGKLKAAERVSVDRQCVISNLRDQVRHLEVRLHSKNEKLWQLGERITHLERHLRDVGGTG